MTAGLQILSTLLDECSVTSCLHIIIHPWAIWWLISSLMFSTLFFFIISYMLPMWNFSLTMENWESLNAFTQGSNSLKVSLPSCAHIIALLNRQTSNNFVPPWSAALGKDCVYCSFKARYSHIKPKCRHLKITTSLQWCWTSLLSPIIFRIIYRKKILN